MILAIANEKGGVAKTTTAVHLGHGLARRGRRILIVDLDPQSNTTTWIGAEQPSVTIAAVFKQITRVREAIAPSTVAGVDLLWSSRETAAAAIELQATVAAAPTVLRRALRPLVPQYDVILLDCAPGLGLVTLNAIVAAQAIIAPVNSAPMAVDGLVELHRTVRDLFDTEVIARVVPITVLLTMFRKRKIVSDIHEQIDSSNVPRFEVVIREGTKVIEAYAERKTVFDLDPRDGVALDYAALAEEIDNAQSPAPASADRPQSG